MVEMLRLSITTHLWYRETPFVSGLQGGGCRLYFRWLMPLFKLVLTPVFWEKRQAICTHCIRAVPPHPWTLHISCQLLPTTLAQLSRLPPGTCKITSSTVFADKGEHRLISWVILYQNASETVWKVRKGLFAVPNVTQECWWNKCSYYTSLYLYGLFTDKGLDRDPYLWKARICRNAF